MIVEYNKGNIILCFLTGVIATFVGKRWLYGSMILLLTACILFQRTILHSNNPLILKYQNITSIPATFMVIALILSTLYILSKSSIKGGQKLFSLVFLVASIGFSISKQVFNKPMFNYTISQYISCLLFMITLLTVSSIPDNQVILRTKYDEFKDKIKHL